MSQSCEIRLSDSSEVVCVEIPAQEKDGGESFSACGVINKTRAEPLKQVGLKVILWKLRCDAAELSFEFQK